jgi:HTH-type transcriptional regulator/antitoxin HipB
VSRQWISAFESGKPGAELALVIRLLDAVGLRLAVDEARRNEAGPPPTGATDLDALLEEHRRS